MSMHRIVLAAITAAFAATVGAETQKPAFYELSAKGEVQIAQDGHVGDYRSKSKLPPSIAALVSKNVLAWRFDPVLVDGKAVVAKTAMQLNLRAELAEGKTEEFVVRIVSVHFGTPTRTKGGRLPRYPDAAVAARLGAKVVLAALLDETGRVIEVVPYQTSLAARASNEKEAEQWRRKFERASIAAAKTWRYDLSETVGGKPIGSYVIIPVEYSISSQSSPSRWSGYVPGPIQLVPWDIPADEKRIAQLGDGEALSIGSRFHLKDDVIGKAL
jgi:hypothetical protein